VLFRSGGNDPWASGGGGDGGWGGGYGNDEPPF